MNINELLKEIRTKKGYSLDVLGGKIGFSKGYLHNVEIGAEKKTSILGAIKDYQKNDKVNDSAKKENKEQER